MRSVLPLFVVLMACGGDDPAADSAADTAGLLATPGGETPSGSAGTATADPHANTYIPPGYGATDPSRIVFLGDSITTGAGASKSSLAYTELLVEDTSNKWSDFADLDLESMFGALEVVDGSVGGATTASMLHQQLDNLEALVGGYPVSGETLIVFTIGGNDVMAALNPFADAAEVAQETLGNIGSIVDALQDATKFPDGAFLYATNVYEPTDGSGQTDACFFGLDFGSDMPVLDQFNEDLRTLGEEKSFAVVDLRGHFAGHGWNHADATLPTHDLDDPSVWLADDCIHPNDRGHHELRRLFQAAIAGTELALVIP